MTSGVRRVLSRRRIYSIFFESSIWMANKIVGVGLEVVRSVRRFLR